MKIPHIAALAVLVLGSFAATGVAPTKSELESMYDKAFQEFDANHYDAALKALDAIDARQPGLAESENLRGVVLMRKGDYDKAEAALRKALDIEPKFWNAQFNLAEIPFLKKDWTEARNRFEALVAGNSDEMRPETKLLIQYKILLTFVLQGKENTADWIINKFEGEKDSPALYYSHAALALHHKNQKEADEWLDAAKKHYSPELNKLFAESFYEIGWLDKPVGESRAAVEITSTAERAERMKSDAQANFERAERAFQQRDFPTALKDLDLADQGAPDQAPFLNLRGEVYMEQKKFDEAEAQFRKAYDADPKFREAQYNLAQIPFKKKDYAKSRERLEALFGETPGGDKNQAAQLIKYKIYMTLLLEGKDSEAQRLMDQFKFTGDTPALYYAQAAWAFKHGNRGQGNDWVSSARKIYSPALNVVFADGFYDLGWLQPPKEAAPPTTALAEANASPAGPKPQMRFGEEGGLPAPVASASPVPSVAASQPAATAKNTSAAASPAASIAAVNANGVPITAVAATAATASPAPSVATASKVQAATTPAISSSTAPVTESTAFAKPAATAPKIVAAAIPSPAATVAATAAPHLVAKHAEAPAAVAKPTAAPGVAAASKAAPVATPAQHRSFFGFHFGSRSKSAKRPVTIDPAEVAALSRPSVAELKARFTQPRMLIFCCLFVVAVIFFAWLMFQQLGRDTDGGVAAFESPLPIPQPRLAGAGGPMPVNERRLPRNSLHVTPPKFSLRLRGSEPALRSGILPSNLISSRAPASKPNGSAGKTGNGSAGTATNGSAVKSMEQPTAVTPNEPAIESRKEAEGFVSEVKTALPASKSPADEISATSTLEKAPAISPNESAETAPTEPPPLRDDAQVSLAAAPPVAVAAVAEKEPAVVAPTNENTALIEEPVDQGEPVPQLIAPAAEETAANAPEIAIAKPDGAEIEEAESKAVEAVEAKVEESEAVKAKVEELGGVEVEAEKSDAAEAKAEESDTVEAKADEPEPVQVNAEESEAITANVEAAPIAAETPVVAAIAEENSEEHSSIETPAFASKIITTQTEPPLITPIIIMPEPTPITAINEPRPTNMPGASIASPAATGSTATISAPTSAAMQTAVQLTFSLEIASLQLTPTFKMGQLQVKPTSKIVAMRLAPSAQPQPAMNLQVTFELSSVQLGAGATLGTVRLTPSAAQRPSLITTPTFEIAGLQLVSGSASAPVQLTPTHQNQASVLMTASFQIATVEFSPSFEIASVVLNSTSKNVAVQLPGAGPSSIEAAPVFEIGAVQLGGSSEIVSIQLNPLGSRRA